MAHRSIQSKRKTCEASHWTIAIVVLICLASGIAAIVCGVLVAKPGLSSMNFKEATCRVIRHDYRTTKKTCDCGGLYSDDPYCKSSFPCVQITVDFQPERKIISVNASKDASFQNTAMLYESETDINGKHKQCSFYNCHPDFEQNKLLVQNFVKKYGQPTSYYHCKYNPYDKDQVVVFTRFNKDHVLLSIIIPLSVFAVCLMILVGVCVFLACRKSRRRAERHTHLHENTYMGHDMPVFEPDEPVQTVITVASDNETSSVDGEDQNGLSSNGVTATEQKDDENAQLQINGATVKAPQMSTPM